MIHMPGCPLIEPTDTSITDVDQWEDVNCDRCKPKRITVTVEDSLAKLGVMCRCTMSGPPREGCPVHGTTVQVASPSALKLSTSEGSVTEPMVRHIEVIGEVEWPVVRVCMDHVFTSPVFRMEAVAKGFGCRFTNKGNVYRFDFTGG